MKNNIKRSKSQDNLSQENYNHVNIKIILSNEEQINVPVPINCPLEIISTLLTKKITQLKGQDVVGFQSVPSDYLFDYRLSKKIGLLNEKKNLTLNCLYKCFSSNNNKEQTLMNQFNEISYHKLNKYKICKPLSSGGFSRVYLVRNLENGEFYAAKFMDKCSEVNLDRQEAIRNQFFVHKSLNHPYVVKMEEYIQTSDFYILIMQYCPGGELFTLLKNNRYMGEQRAKVIFVQVLLAIKYLHDRNIVFRDIKPENILIDQKGNAKLTDFGLAKQIRGKTNSYCGSVEYMAPQIVSKQFYSLDVDLYCMGALLYEILIGCPPFYNPNFTNNETKYHICNSDVCFPSKVPLSEEVKDLISSLLVKNPNQRLGHFNGVDEILDHEWIGNISIDVFLKGQVQNPFIPNLSVENFDRQEDQFEKQFRAKILQDLKRCKKIHFQDKHMKKVKQPIEMKKKSKTIDLSSKKHMKSKSNIQFDLCEHQKRPSELVKQMTLSNSKWINQKQNPYAFKIKNKSVSQLIPGFKSLNKTQNNQKNFKKKSLHRTLSRSMNKSNFSISKNTFDPQNKTQINKILLVNSKSCQNSRKNSIYKKFIQSGHENKSNKIDFMNSKSKVKFHESNNHKKSISLIPQKQFLISNLKRQSQSKEQVSINFKSFTKNLEKEELYIPKQSNQKQNYQSKGLKRKNMLKKKFLFSSVAKDASKIKQNHFNFDKKLFQEQKTIKNRLTVV